MKRQELKVKIKNGSMKTAKYIYKRKDIIISFVILAVLLTPKIVLADTANNNTTDTTTSTAGDAEWTFITNLITKWGKRIGGVVALIGGAEFGLGWKDDRADQKTQGLRILVAGLIVLAVFGAGDTFLK